MTKIFYFSATGNSLWSAKKIAHNIYSDAPDEKYELVNIGKAAYEVSPEKGDLKISNKKKRKYLIEADTVIFIFPSFAYGMPRVMRNFVKNAEFKTSYLAALVTYGSSPGGTLGSLRRILKKKKIDKMFFGKIPAVENYLAIFGTPSGDTIKKRCEMQKQVTEALTRSIIERKENRVSMFYPLSFIIYCLFSLGIKLFYKFYKVSDKCTGCGICEKICPVSAIIMKEKTSGGVLKRQPRFTSKCEHCQGCVDLCPLRAIQFARVRFGAPGYRHPEININELMK